MAIVAFDTSFLIKLPKVTGKGSVDSRLAYLIATLDKNKDDIIIPTPALSEVLIGAGDAAPAYLDILNKTARIRIAPFGTRAAVEAAARHREAIDAGDKKEGAPNWDKVKYDRQIVAIAKVEGAERIYSEDADVARFGKASGMSVFRLADLESPPPKTPDLFDRLSPTDQTDAS
ncbi:PIN domain-containing protein [Bradyrhizobium australiense]|uniref:PIN domain-containing protein n=1 Tax=Bradyrhizobium australiense TaxID=2721161 RepID=A0A7Y4LYI9_9BRAD|nr:PIN domain-containing protein [Bradyrhizobium australiense]NOJ43306.1 PIN domain-containing protein [Bradyrhizobium australiense]